MVRWPFRAVNCGGSPGQRDKHRARIQEKRRSGWQVATEYRKWALVESMMGCFKTLTGTRLRARTFAGQQAEAAIRVAVVNRLLLSIPVFIISARQ